MFKRLSIFVALLFVAFAVTAQAQLKPGSFGIGANFSSYSPYAMVHYALSDNMELGAGLGLSSVSYDYENEDSEPDSESTLHFVAIGKYFLDRGRDVSPYVGARIGYSSYPGESEYYEDYSRTNFSIGALFGGQVFLAKQFAVYANIGLGYSMLSENYESQGGDDATNSKTTISLDGSSIGAVFFF